ncbi:MAG: hypothetical protein WCX74_02610 [Candidatus Paceibacterota bacterium]
MKNLPDKFPIRYALILGHLHEPNEDELLFNQYLALLNKQPLDYSLFCADMISVDFRIHNRDAFGIVKINEGKNESDFKIWADSIEDRLKEVIPSITIKSWGGGHAFRVGMYSYKKSAEIPAFTQFKPSCWCNVNFEKVFNRIKNGKYDTFLLYQELGAYLKGIRQDLFYSNIWKCLDSNKELGGFVYDSFDLEDKIIFNKVPKNEEVKEKIPVMICRSWEELFAEEIFALYKMFNYCNNCGKALPFNYNGKYCPNTPESIECIRERGRKRKHSQSNN